MKKMKRKKVSKKRLVIETKSKGNDSPTLRQECKDYTSLDYYNDNKLKKLSFRIYGDDLL